MLVAGQQSIRAQRQRTELPSAEDPGEAAAKSLLARIEEFAGQLAVAPVQKSVAERLNVARELTSVIGYLVEGFGDLRRSSHALRRYPEVAPVRDQVLAALDMLFGLTAEAVDTRQPAAIERLREQSRSHGSLVEQAREGCVRAIAALDGDEAAVARRTALLKMLGDFDLITWIVHRLAKLLETVALVHTACERRACRQTNRTDKTAPHDAAPH